MATDSHNTPALTAATAVPNGLPPGIRELDLAGTVSDARHLAQLIDCTLEGMVAMTAETPQQRHALERATSFLWIARDLAELLEWKLERLDAECHLQRRQ